MLQMVTAQATGSNAERIAEVIFEYAAKISREQDIVGLISLNADLARDLVGAERCSLWLVDEGTGELWTRVAHGIEQIRIPGGRGIVGACIAQGQTLVVNDAPSDKRFCRDIDNSSGYRTDSVLCVPLCHEKGVIGALQLLNKASGFSEGDAEVVRLTAIYAASAIQTEWLRQEAETARLFKHELALAANVQQRLFPEESSGVRGLEYTGFCRSAKFVGGDYYDFLELARDTFGFTLGDVSGKGLPAAVLMASIQTLLRALLHHNPQALSSGIIELNEALYHSSTAERYSTLFCGAVNAERNQMTYVNAGHIPPFVARRNGSIERPAEGNLPVGLMSSLSYGQHCIHLDAGDMIACVSDGIIEAQNSGGELWNESELESILRQHRSAPLKQVVQCVIQAVDNFVGDAEQFDDMTVILVRICSP
jgi:phosphoserine phosphatase RsbU/P